MVNMLCAQALNQLFGVLTDAVENRDHTRLDTALNGIVEIVKDSPLKDIEAFRQARIAGEEIEL